MGLTPGENWRKSTYCAHGDCLEAQWRKSSFCEGGQCVQAQVGWSIRIRDSKNPDGPQLTVTPDHWRELLDAIKAGEPA